MHAPSGRTRVAVIGPGAIGGAVAGALGQAGHLPVLCGRGEPFERLHVDVGGRPAHRVARTQRGRG